MRCHPYWDTLCRFRWVMANSIRRYYCWALWNVPLFFSWNWLRWRFTTARKLSLLCSFPVMKTQLYGNMLMIKTDLTLLDQKIPEGTYFLFFYLCMPIPPKQFFLRSMHIHLPCAFFEAFNYHQILCFYQCDQKLFIFAGICSVN